MKTKPKIIEYIIYEERCITLWQKKGKKPKKIIARMNKHRKLQNKDFQAQVKNLAREC